MIRRILAATAIVGIAVAGTATLASASVFDGPNPLERILGENSPLSSLLGGGGLSDLLDRGDGAPHEQQYPGDGPGDGPGDRYPGDGPYGEYRGDGPQG
ncbi:hypothetical protein [Planomonospora algeriensis]